ncbi:hypothetical protein BS47DRAFT_207056 [Hydnum rufescens UP504]|uniref:Uncharacterized protein n=1 Tax=Hydnum rufescens UP504 TaxID=1448309 RepID=A0A9P6AMZ8_9AGAM|nr:hypothetical protein BS47DRAFT_207056 [Hydnum rufescens UP504]
MIFLLASVSSASPGLSSTPSKQSFATRKRTACERFEIVTWTSWASRFLRSEGRVGRVRLNGFGRVRGGAGTRCRGRLGFLTALETEGSAIDGGEASSEVNAGCGYIQ